MKKSNAEAARKSRERAKVRDQQQKEKLERLIEENSRMKKQIAEKQKAKNIMADIIEKNSNEEKEILSQAVQPSDVYVSLENKSDLSDKIKFISDGVSSVNIENETKITEVCHPCQDDYSNIKTVLEDNSQETFIENLNLIPNEPVPLTNEDNLDDLFSQKCITLMEQNSNNCQKMNISLSESDYKLLSLSFECSESFKNKVKHNETDSALLNIKLIDQDGQDQKMSLSLSKNSLRLFYQNIESQESLLNTVKQNKTDSTELQRKDDVKTSTKSLSLLSLSNMSIDISFSSLVP